MRVNCTHLVVETFAKAKQRLNRKQWGFCCCFFFFNWGSFKNQCSASICKPHHSSYSKKRGWNVQVVAVNADSSNNRLTSDSSRSWLHIYAKFEGNKKGFLFFMCTQHDHSWLANCVAIWHGTKQGKRINWNAQLQSVKLITTNQLRNLGFQWLKSICLCRIWEKNKESGWLKCSAGRGMNAV